MLTALLVLAALPAATSASQGGGPATALVRPPKVERWNADKANPYSRLFNPERGLPAVAPEASAKPAIKCGMTMIPADPKGFPGIILPKESRTKFTIRAIDPALCK